MNAIESHAEHGYNTLLVHAQYVGLKMGANDGGNEAVIVDLLTSLMHLSPAYNFDLDEMFRKAKDRFEIEQSEGEFQSYMGRLKAVLEANPGKIAVYGGNYNMLDAESSNGLAWGGVYADGDVGPPQGEPESCAWEEDWKQRLDEWFANPKFLSIPDSFKCD